MSATVALPLGEREVLEALRREAHPLTGDHRDYDPLLALVGDARIVLIGEASHGTHEFYRERARITKRLIAERGFDAVAIEGDWPDAYRVNRYVQGGRTDPHAEAALAGFRRFPTWMWRNADVLDFVGWLRAHNEGLHHGARKAGFYGLDLYSLGESMHAVIDYLDHEDPAAAARARARYECLQPYAGESAAYGQAVLLGVGEPCRRRVIEQLVELRRRAGEYLLRDGLAAEDEYFFAEQNAAVVANAEEYYRTMFSERAGSWNLRDRHMADTLDQLLAHRDRHGGTSRIVVWAHNSHVGDARATEMAARGELNIGQLMRERHGRDAVSVGFRATREPSPPPPSGAPRPSAGASGLRSPTAMKRCSTAPTSTRSSSALCPRVTAGGRCASLGCTARSVSSTGPRPSARATGSQPASPRSTTRSCIWTRPGRSSRSSAPRRGSSASHPRPIRPRSDPSTARLYTREVRGCVGRNPQS
jgi:erythromycin esterase-like protein